MSRREADKAGSTRPTKLLRLLVTMKLMVAVKECICDGRRR